MGDFEQRFESLTLAEGQKEQWVMGHQHFPIHLFHNDILSLVRKKQSKKNLGDLLEYNIWLNTTTIDTIVLFDFELNQKKEKPSQKTVGEKENIGQPFPSSFPSSSSSLSTNKCYIGSGFQAAVIQEASEEFIGKIQRLLMTHEVIMIVNTGMHWVLFILSSERMSILDPMHSSSIPVAFITFAARVYDKIGELYRTLPEAIPNHSFRNRIQTISVRSKVSKANLSFFKLKSVAVQLREEEGYNCGLYCALWARALFSLSSVTNLSDLLMRDYSGEDFGVVLKKMDRGIDAGGKIDLNLNHLKFTKQELEISRRWWSDIFARGSYYFRNVFSNEL